MDWWPTRSTRFRKAANPELPSAFAGRRHVGTSAPSGYPRLTRGIDPALHEPTGMAALGMGVARLNAPGVIADWQEREVNKDLSGPNRDDRILELSI